LVGGIRSSRYRHVGFIDQLHHIIGAGRWGGDRQIVLIIRRTRDLVGPGRAFLRRRGPIFTLLRVWAKIATQVIPNARLCKALIHRITDRATIIETGTESYRFRRTLEKRKGKSLETKT
jgi:hypothetical protein